MNLSWKYESVTILEYKTLDNYKGYLVQIKPMGENGQRSGEHTQNTRKEQNWRVNTGKQRF